MAILVHWQESGRLKQRLKELAEAVDPQRAKMTRLRGELAKVAAKDNSEKLLSYGSGLAGVDRFGRPLAPLGAWATGAAFRRRGNGPVLAPHGLASRIITAFRTVWTWDGRQWRLTAGWDAAVAGWMRYHLEGRPKGSHPLYPNWSLPKRDVGGLSPKGSGEVRSLFGRFWANLIKNG